MWKLAGGGGGGIGRAIYKTGVKLIVSVLGCIIICAVAITTCAYIYQNRLIFIPMGTPEANPKMHQSPSEYKIPYEDIFIDSTDGAKLHLWFLKQRQISENELPPPTIIFFHGNAGNVGYRLPNLAQMFHLADVNIIAVSYRGYGLSTGTPTEQGLFDDGQTVLDYVRTRKDIDQSKIFIFGRSLGGAIAIRTTAKNQPYVAGCIVENSFSSLRALARELAPAFTPVLGWLLKSHFNSLDSIKQIQTPIMLISGQQDTLIATSHMQRLLAACAAPCRWHVLIHGGEHNDSHLVNPTVYYDALKKFMTTALLKHESSSSSEALFERVIDIRQDNLSSPDNTDDATKTGAQRVSVTEKVMPTTATSSSKPAPPIHLLKTTTTTTASERREGGESPALISSRPSRYFETVVRQKGPSAIWTDRS